MDLHQPSSDQLGKTADRLALFQHHLENPSRSQPSSGSTPTNTNPATMSRDPVTCHVLNTLTGTPAAHLPVTLTLLSAPTAGQGAVIYNATTDADGRVKNWTPATGTSSTVPAFLSSLPAPDSKTSWSISFKVGPWYEAQGVECFWPEVEVKFNVKGRGREGEEGWRHYHVPVLLGPWNYSTYRGS
jgi:5-hydroxyisourate hydrolase